MLNVLAVVLLASAVSADQHFENINKRQTTATGGGNAACSSFLAIDSSCSAKTTGFSSLALSAQLSCYCTQGSTYAGASFDGYLGSCLSYFATASPSYYSASLSGSIPTTPCAASLAKATTSSASTPTVTGLAACTSWNSIYASCTSATTSFASLIFSAAASCACYQGTSWAPQVYDALWGNCLAYYSTASSSFYSSLASGGINTTPCKSAGNVRAGAATASASTTASSSVASLSLITVVINGTGSGNNGGNNNNNNNNNSDGGLSTGAKAGIGAGVGAAALALIAVGAFFLYKKKQRKEKAGPTAAAAAVAPAPAPGPQPPMQDYKPAYQTQQAYQPQQRESYMTTSELPSPGGTHQSYQPYAPDYKTGAAGVAPVGSHNSYQAYNPNSEYQMSATAGPIPVELPSEPVHGGHQSPPSYPSSPPQRHAAPSTQPSELGSPTHTSSHMPPSELGSHDAHSPR